MVCLPPSRRTAQAQGLSSGTEQIYVLHRARWLLLARLTYKAERARQVAMLSRGEEYDQDDAADAAR